MKSSPLSVPLTTALALAGCGTTPPLYFADTTSFGIRLGTETTTAGGSVSVATRPTALRWSGVGGETQWRSRRLARQEP